MAQRKKLSEKVDKRRRAKVVVGHDADGKPIIKYVSGRTKHELDEAKEELIRTYIGGTKLKRDVLFDDYCKEWYETYKKPTVSASSQSNYRSVLRTHILTAFNDRQMRSITATELQTFMNDKSKMGTTILTYIKAILTGAFRTAYTQGLIDRDPTVGLKAPSVKGESRRALTPQETDAVLRVAGSHPEGLLLALLYYTGCRVGEVLGLRWGDISFSTKTIKIERDIDYVTNSVGDLKTATSHRTIPMAAELEAMLFPIRGFGSTYIIQGELTGSFLPKKTYDRRWKRLMIAVAKANLEIEEMKAGKNAHHTIETKEVKYDGSSIPASILTAHFFRHNFATLLYEAGVDVQDAARILGHARVSTTLEIYTHLSKVHQAKNDDKVRQLFSQRLPKGCQN